MQKSYLHLFSPLYFFYLIACNNPNNNLESSILKFDTIQIIKKNTVDTRFNLPVGFYREIKDSLSFAFFLRNLPLKPEGATVRYYNGNTKPAEGIYTAVVDMEISDKNLQQCADAVIRLRAEYLYKTKQFDKINFNFTNGFKASYSEWTKGNRIIVKGNNVSWKKTTNPSNSYNDLRNYLEVVFTYAGTLSLSKELKKIELNEIEPGDVFIKGGSPGHAVIVVDVAVNSKTNKKIFILAQSYMPAQETQILINSNSKELSPWYSADNFVELKTPEWTFATNELMRF
jgi:Domain of unknown function (4846)